MVKKINLMRVALSFVVAVCFGFLFASNRAYAYTAEENFYPFDVESSQLLFELNGDILWDGYADFNDGKYHFSNPMYSNIDSIYWYPNRTLDHEWTFPCNFDLYDYYILGTLTGAYTDVNHSTFKPSVIRVNYYNFTTKNLDYYNISDLNIYDIDIRSVAGFGFYGKIDFQSSDNIGIYRVDMLKDLEGTGSKPANLMFEFGVLAVEKGQGENVVLSQILKQLQNMESSFNESIGSAADQLTGSIDSASESITSKLQESFDSLTSNLTDWFDDVFNGYQGTGTSDASDKFDQSAGELHSVESSLTGITNTSIGSYTESAFDTTVITSLGSSLVYVVTWFTNFWNMGGLFSSILNIGLALSIACFILRLRGAK